MSQFFSLFKRASPISLPFQEGSFWVLDLEEIGLEEVEAAKTILNRADLDKAAGYVFEKDWKRSLLVYALLKMHLGQMLNEAPENISFLRNEFGKPYLAGFPLHFNLSHAEKKAVLGAHPTRLIGVDIEENQTLDLDFKGADPLTFWCATEALLKAAGTGFSDNLWPEFKRWEVKAQGIDFLVAERGEVYVYHEAISGYKIAVSIL